MEKEKDVKAQVQEIEKKDEVTKEKISERGDNIKGKHKTP